MLSQERRKDTTSPSASHHQITISWNQGQHQAKNATAPVIVLLPYYHRVQVNWSNIHIKHIVFSKYRTGDTVPDKNVGKTPSLSFTKGKTYLFLM